MTFAAKLRANLEGRNKHFTPDKKSVTGDFSIEHYAGPVPYRCTKFLDKNRDSLSMGELLQPYSVVSDHVMVGPVSR